MRRIAQKPRLAISLIEVTFSMGVVLIGLLGVMSILPLAGKRAQDSVSLSVGATLGDSVAKNISSRGWLQSERLIARNLNLPTGALEVFAGGEPFCIDPSFVSGNSFAPLSNGYEARLFPFYKLNHDPTIDPAAEQTSTTVWPAAQPRMRRVGINRDVGTAVPLTLSEAFHVGDSGDDLLLQRPKARTADIFRPGFEATTVTGGLPYASRFATGEYSWIATVNPLPGGLYADLSVVVIRNRQRSYSVPTEAVQIPERNATDERLAYVSFASGFTGGAGGEVHLLSNSNTIFRVRSGDWIMLSSIWGGNPKHRWYRVSAVDALDRNGEPERFADTPAELLPAIGTRLPGDHTRALWRRKVYLSGPDWFFGHGTDKFATTSYAGNTFATLIEGVVSVTEHVVKLRSL